jgi:hypothetical protein
MILVTNEFCYYVIIILTSLIQITLQFRYSYHNCELFYRRLYSHNLRSSQGMSVTQI